MAQELPPGSVSDPRRQTMRSAFAAAGSSSRWCGGERAAFMYTLIGTAKLKVVDPQAWLADILTRIADTPRSRLGDLLPWNWNAASTPAQAA